MHGIMFHSVFTDGRLFLKIGQRFHVMGMSIQIKKNIIYCKAGEKEFDCRRIRSRYYNLTSAAASFPAEGFAKLWEDGSHGEGFTGIKNFFKFLSGNIGHG